MSHDVLIFAVEGDRDAAAALAAAVHELDPIICALTATQTSLRTGGNAAVVCLWSSCAHDAGLAPVLQALCAQHPRSTLLWRLDDTPWPEHETIDPKVVVIGPDAQGPDALAAAGAVRLAVRRTADVSAPHAPARKREAPIWPAVAIGVAIIGGLTVAGAAAWLDAPPRPRLTVEAPLAPPAARPSASQSPTHPSPADALASALDADAAPQDDATVATKTRDPMTQPPRDGARDASAQTIRTPIDSASSASDGATTDDGFTEATPSRAADADSAPDFSAAPSTRPSHAEAPPLPPPPTP